MKVGACESAIATEFGMPKSSSLIKEMENGGKCKVS